MDAKVGDRISIDARTVGQPRRQGTVTDIAEGLSGKRYTVNWDDGTSSTFAPSGGNLIVEGRAKGGAKKKASSNNRKPASGKKTAKKTTAAKKPAGKKGSPAKKAAGKKKGKR